MPVGSPNFSQGSPEEYPDSRNPAQHPALQPETPSQVSQQDSSEQAHPAQQPGYTPQPQQRPTPPMYSAPHHQLAPRPVQHPGQFAQNPHGVRIVQSQQFRQPLPAAGHRRPNLPTPPQRPEANVSRRGSRVLIGTMVVALALGGVAAYDTALGHDKIKASLGWNAAEQAQSKKTSIVGAAPEVPAVTTTTSPSPTTTKPAPTEKPTTKAPVVPVVPVESDCITKIPDNVLIAQKIMAPVTGDNLKEMAPVFSKKYVGGAILMASPTNPADGSILAFKKAQSVGIEMAIDQESGNPTDKTQKYGVARIKVPASKRQPLGYMPTAAQMAKMKPEQITAIVAENYATLKKYGINTSFGTVVDVAPATGASILGKDRVPSSDPAVVTAYAKAYIAGAKKAGVNPVVKHWGMGSANANTDNGPAVTPSLASLQKRDFVPYTELKKADIDVDAMIGSEVIPGLTEGKDKKVGTADDVPVSLSRAAVTGVFKKVYLSPDAITYTDDLGAPGISYKWSVAEASVAAWKAGVDEGLFVVTTAKSPTKKMTVAEQLDAVISEGVAELKSGELNRKETQESVMRLWGHKALTACGVLKTVNPDGYKALTVPKPTTTAKSATPTKKQTAQPMPANPDATATVLPMPAGTKPNTTAEPMSAKTTK